MPYPAQINTERIIEKAREMLESDGVEQLSLHRLAAALGVKAPSLYRYFDSKTDLLRALSLQTAQQLTASMQGTDSAGGDSREHMLALARNWRAFGHAFPMTYMLAFNNPKPELRPGDELLEALAIPIQRVMAEISGEEHSLAALRGLWALIHGFMLLELSGQFQRGGDLEAAFTESVNGYLNGWSCEST